MSKCNHRKALMPPEKGSRAPSASMHLSEATVSCTAFGVGVCRLHRLHLLRPGTVHPYAVLVVPPQPACGSLYPACTASITLSLINIPVHQQGRPTACAGSLVHRCLYKRSCNASPAHISTLHASWPRTQHNPAAKRGFQYPWPKHCAHPLTYSSTACAAF